MSEDKTQVRAKFNARLFPLIAPFMATTDIRYYLNGFLIERAERGGVYVVATNGRAMAVVHDAEGVIEGADQLIVRRDAGLLKACKARASMPPSVIVSDGRVIVAPDFDMIASNLETYVMPGKPFIEAIYPKWKKVLPDFAKLQPGMRSSLVNSGYLALFDGVSKFGNMRFPSVRFWQQDDATSAIVIQVPTHPEFVGVVMPMHDHEEDCSKNLLSVFK